ncbi:MAG TPA: ATP-binding protein [Myxococcales bacterium]|nr:ATP-binding protein [Myxococcales bacterium]
MEPKRPIDSAGDADGSVALAGSLVELRGKYVELARKYSALVRRLEVRTNELKSRRADGEIFVQRLGFWALNATGGGLAVVQRDQVTIRNSRWLALASAPGGWVREGSSTEAPTYLDLMQIVFDEAKQIPDKVRSVLVRRYQKVAEGPVIELRLERVDPATVVVLAQDVTTQANAEQELVQTREALFQSEHMSILGELASSISHELGNTLRAVSTRATVLSQDPSVMAAHAELLRGLQESAEAALDSVRKLHDLARTGRLKPGPVDLADVIRRAVDVLELRRPPGTPEVVVHLEVSQVPPVLGTTSELSHLFVTLLFNARDAMPKGGKIEVRAERAGDRVRVTVADEGTGIDAEVMTHLFQPFFTTKGSAGTGLGLWLAHTTMRRLGGSIAAHNRKAGGAEFVVEFLLAANGKVFRGGALVRRVGTGEKTTRDRERERRQGRGDRRG